MINFKQAIKDGMPPSQDMIDEEISNLETEFNSHLKKIGVIVTIFAVIGAWVYATLFSVATVGFYERLSLVATSVFGVVGIAFVIFVILYDIFQSKGWSLKNFITATSTGVFTGVISGYISNYSGMPAQGVYATAVALGTAAAITMRFRLGAFRLYDMIIGRKVYADFLLLSHLSGNKLFSAYFKELGAMKREITRAEVEAMKSILKDKAASEGEEMIYGGSPKPNDQNKYGKIFSGVYDPDDCVYSISRDEYGMVEKVFPAQHGRSPWMIVGFLDDVKLQYKVDGTDINTGKLDLLPWGEYCTDYGERQRHPYETEDTKSKSFIRGNDNE